MTNHIYLIDTSNQMHLLEKICSDTVTLKNKKFICNDAINNAVCNHIGGINYAFELGNSEYVCILDPDTIFINKWEEKLIPLLDTNCFISNRFEPGLNIARPQLMFFKRKFWIDNKLRFEYFKDTGGNITLFCQKHDKKFFILDNSYNNKELIEKHAFPDIYCEQCFIDDIPFFLHQGRGGLKGDRSTWIQFFTVFLKRN